MHAEPQGADRSATATHSAPLVLGSFGNTVPAAPITVMIASDHKVLHTAWLPVLARDAGIELKGEPVMDATRLMTCVEHHQPKVLLLDKALLDGLEPQSLRRIREQCRVLLLWNEICHGLVADVLRNQFHGVLLTTCQPEACLKAIRAVCKGELWLSRAALAMAVSDLLGIPGRADAGASTDGRRIDASGTLTPRELQVVELLRQGCINKEIARELGIMEDTVKKHLQSVFAKLGVHRRALVALRGLPGYAVPQSVP